MTEQILKDLRDLAELIEGRRKSASSAVAMSTNREWRSFYQGLEEAYDQAYDKITEVLAEHQPWEPKPGTWARIKRGADATVPDDVHTVLVTKVYDGDLTVERLASVAWVNYPNHYGHCGAVVSVDILEEV